MGRFLFDADVDTHIHDYPEAAQTQWRSVWWCSCHRLFIVEDSQRDGHYWVEIDAGVARQRMIAAGLSTDDVTRRLKQREDAMD